MSQNNQQPQRTDRQHEQQKATAASEQHEAHQKNLTQASATVKKKEQDKRKDSLDNMPLL